jgi:hypothetical protein
MRRTLKSPPDSLCRWYSGAVMDSAATWKPLQPEAAPSLSLTEQNSDALIRGVRLGQYGLPASLRTFVTLLWHYRVRV